MSWMTTSRFLVRPWHVALSVALLGTAGAGGAVLFTHHAQHVQVRVLGERFQPNTTSGGSTSDSGGASASPNKGGGPGGTGNGNGGGRPNLTFTIAASVSGLVPGQAATLPVQITNPKTNGGTLTVNTINVTTQDITSGGVVVCGRSNLQLTDYDSTTPGATVYAIPSGGSTTIPLPILFKDTTTVDQTSCQGMTFTLSISGTATVTHP